MNSITKHLDSNIAVRNCTTPNGTDVPNQFIITTSYGRLFRSYSSNIAFIPNDEDIIYFGSQTRYWVRCGEYRICAEQQHRTFQLDQTAPSWGDAVWLRWHANDGFLLEQYREEDEELLTLPEE